MAFSGQGGFPAEYASKIGHMRAIRDPLIQQMVASFESAETDHLVPTPTSPLQHSALDTPLAQIITVDGSDTTVESLFRPDARMSIVQIAAQLFKMETLERLIADPNMDPRVSAGLTSKPVSHHQAVLPLSGVYLPGQTVRQTLRTTIRFFLSDWGLDQTLKELVYRSWAQTWPPVSGVPFQECVEPKCDGQVFWQSRYAMTAECDTCGARHYLSDYLGLTSELGEDRPREEVVHNFRQVAEALYLFTFILRYRGVQGAKTILGRTLFMVDGPLLLRANLSRLVPAIRDLLETQNAIGAPIYLVGVEKTGDFRSYVSSLERDLPTVGDYFALPVDFYVEQVAGHRFNPSTYENRVNYGAKIAARVGDFHTLALDIPTGQFKLSPTPKDLIGIDRILSTLSKVTGVKYKNALVPLWLINEQASISVEPSSTILQTFVDTLLKRGVVG